VLFADPDAPDRVRAELEVELAHAGYSSLDDAYRASFEIVAKPAN
jgi:hypothetical protein